jgi:hypothetical protein
MEENKIKNIILDYCEVDQMGQESLDEMVEKIKQLVKEEIRDYVVAYKKEKLGLFFSNR